MKLLEVPTTSIESAWAAINGHLREDMSQEARARCRRMFYVGAGSMLACMMDTATPEHIARDPKGEKIKSLLAEIKEFQFEGFLSALAEGFADLIEGAPDHG